MTTRFRRVITIVLMLVSLGLLVGDDCEFEIEDIGWPVWHDDCYDYCGGPVYYDVYPVPWYWW